MEWRIQSKDCIRYPWQWIIL